MNVITISRQLGSGGSYLGKRLARRLGYAYADRKILKFAAETLGVDMQELAYRDERPQSYWERLALVFSLGAPDDPCMLPSRKIFSDEELLEVESRLIQDLAARGSCVIVGHGGFHLLKNHERALHVFVHASMPFRIERIMRLHGIAAYDEARRTVEKSDQDRLSLVRHVTGTNWHDSSNFHLTIDTERLGFEESERIIASLAEPSSVPIAPVSPNLADDREQ